MRFVIVSSLYPPYQRGGAEVVARDVVSALKNHGHEAIVISSAPWSGFSSLQARSEDIEGTRVWRFFPLNLFWFGNIGRKNVFSRFLWHIFDVLNLHAFMVISSILKIEKPDAVLTHNLKGIGYLSVRAGVKLGIPVFHTAHDVALLTPSGLILYGKENAWVHRNIFTRWYRWMNKKIFAGCDVAIFPSNFLKERHELYGFFQKSRKIMLINPLVNVDFFVLSKSLSLTPSLSEERDKSLQCLFLGQIENYKGILFLIEILQKLETRQGYRDRFQLHIIGDGKLLPRIREKVADDSHFVIHGRVSREHLQTVFFNKDLLLFPTLCYESEPAAIVESFAFGVPVLASDIGGIPEMVLDNENGWLVKAEDGDGWMKKIMEAIDRRDRISKMRQCCFASAERFTETKYCEGLMSVIQRLKNARVGM